jgi:hypothetical protein
LRSKLKRRIGREQERRWLLKGRVEGKRVRRAYHPKFRKVLQIMRGINYLKKSISKNHLKEARINRSRLKNWKRKPCIMIYL